MEKKAIGTHDKIEKGLGVKYTLRHTKRSRGFRVTVHPGGEVVVSTHRVVPVAIIERFLEEKSKWLSLAIERMKHFPKRKSTRERRTEYLATKASALELVDAKIEHFNQTYGFVHGKITVKNQKSLWGSCSKKSNLNFNYKIALLPEHLADYLVVHELCHLGEFNHSKKFWDLVARTIPDYVTRRKELKKHGLGVV